MLTDEFRTWNVSRQRKYQFRMRKAGRCENCGRDSPQKAHCQDCVATRVDAARRRRKELRVVAPSKLDVQSLSDDRKQRYRERIEAGVYKDRSSGCWNWLGAVVEPERKSRTSHLYPQMCLGIGGKTWSVYVAKFYWELTRGPLRGNEFLRTCDGSRCVNPEHHKDGTATERAARIWMERRKRGNVGWKLTDADRKAIVYHASQGVPTSYLADVYGVSVNYTRRIVREGRQT